MNETDDLERRLLSAGTLLTTEPPDLPTAAAAAGLLDVAYATTDSPLGPLLLASTDQGLVRVAYLDFARPRGGPAVARRPRVATDARGAAPARRAAA